MYNPYSEPKNFTLGQISDDIMKINSVNKTGDFIAQDFNRIASLLRAICFENPTI